MRTWSDGRFLRRPHREGNLRRRRREVQAQAAHTFSVSFSSVKRYVNKAERGESLAPKKSPGSLPKLDEKAARLLAADLEERPYLTLRERCDYVETMTGLAVSRSTMCRAIARIGSTRKKEDEVPQNAMSPRGQPSR
jgi:transposase